MQIDEHIPPKQLVTMIRSLLSFIIIDGKRLVDDEHKQEYITRYLYILSKTMNGIAPIVNMKELIGQIEQDIEDLSTSQE